jgi:hypothetical protein
MSAMLCEPKPLVRMGERGRAFAPPPPPLL